MVSYIIKQRYHVLSCKRADFHLENRIKINNDTTDGLTKMFDYNTVQLIGKMRDLERDHWIINYSFLNYY